MTFIPTDLTHLQVNLQNDAKYWQNVYTYLEIRLKEYNANCTTTNMTALSISTADQNAILAFLADWNRTFQYMQGTVPGVGDDQMATVANLIGVA